MIVEGDMQAHKFATLPHEGEEAATRGGVQVGGAKRGGGVMEEGDMQAHKFATLPHEGEEAATSGGIQVGGSSSSTTGLNFGAGRVPMYALPSSSMPYEAASGMSDEQGMGHAMKRDSRIFVSGDTMYLGGTMSLQDAKDDVQYVSVGQIGKTRRYKDAMAALKTKPWITRVVGYSLGGAVAQRMGEEDDTLTVVTFAAPTYVSPKKGIAFRHRLDPISALNTQATTQDFRLGDFVDPHTYRGFQPVDPKRDQGLRSKGLSTSQWKERSNRNRVKRATKKARAQLARSASKKGALSPIVPSTPAARPTGKSTLTPGKTKRRKRMKGVAKSKARRKGSAPTEIDTDFDSDDEIDVVVDVSDADV